MRFRVAFIHDAYTTYRRPLFRLLADRFDIRFFFLNEPGGNLPAGAESVRAWRIPIMSDYVVAPALAARIRDAHAKRPFDVVFLPEPALFSAQAAWWTARRLHLPYIAWSGEWYPARHPRRWLTSPWERAIVRGAAVCLVYGSRVRSRLRRMGVDSDRILLTGNASDYRYRPAPAAAVEQLRRDWGIGGRSVILFLGRMVAFKAPDVLVEAAARLPAEKVFLVLAGDGPMLPGLRRQVERRGLRNIHCTGCEVRGAEEKNLLYSLADLFVLPSRAGRIAEPWGLVLNEAAQAALPIVTAETVGAVGDLIRDGENGLVVGEGDPQALAGALTRMLLSPETAETYGNRAKRASAAFTIERMADAFETAFLRAVEES
jgi:glycosyltransferase involved in cell wall biosynthesis